MLLPPGLMKLDATYFGTQLTNPTTPDASSGGLPQAESLAGTPATFPVLERIPDSNGFRKPVGHIECRALFVKNASGGTLDPGSVVDWEPDHMGRWIDATTAEAGDDVILNAGIVSPYLSNPVLDNDFFWLIVGGLTFVRVINAAYTSGTPLVMDDVAAGRVEAKVGAYALGDIAIAAEAKTTTNADFYLKAIVFPHRHYF